MDEQFYLMKKFRITKCSHCGLMSLNPQPTTEELAKIYNENYFLHTGEEKEIFSYLKSCTARDYLFLLEQYVPSGKLNGSLLEIGCGYGDFLAEAMTYGLDVTGVEYSPHAASIAHKKIAPKGKVFPGEISQLNNKKKFNYIVLADVLEHVRDPQLFLKTIHNLLEKDGIIFVAVPSLDSFSAKLMKNKWMEFKTEHLWYFSKKTLNQLLTSENFSQIKTTSAKKTLNLDYIIQHFEHYPVAPFTQAAKLIKKIIPKVLKKQPFRIVASGIVSMATKLEN